MNNKIKVFVKKIHFYRRKDYFEEFKSFDFFIDTYFDCLKFLFK